jgi:hypothetical protein
VRRAIRTGATAALFLPACALAQQDLSFSTSVDLNYKKLTLSTISVNQSTGVGTENVFKPTLWMLNVSPSMAWKGVFLTVGLERSLGESSTSGSASNGTWNDRRYSREENSATLGYNVWAGLSLFAGYLHNKTTTNIIQGDNTGSPFQFLTSKVVEKGPYYGVAYAQRLGDGTIAASFARLNGKGESYTDNSINTDTSGSGTVKGNSYGLSWSAPLSGSLYYRLGYKGTRYDFAFTDNLGFPRRTKQNYDAVYLGVANYF